MTTQHHDPVTPTRPEPAAEPTTGPATPRRGWALLAAALGFVAFYVATDFVTPALASSDLPLPDDPVRQVRDWYADNQLAATMIGVSQLLSVCCLGAFALAPPRTARSSAQLAVLRRARTWGLVAMALMMVSSALAWLLAATAPTASLDAVSALRTANFVAGGTAHVAALGVFVWLASRAPGFGRPVRVLAGVAVVVGLLSLASLLSLNAAAFILLGRLLCMAWAVSAAVSILRGTATGRWA